MPTVTPVSHHLEGDGGRAGVLARPTGGSWPPASASCWLAASSTQPGDFCQCPQCRQCRSRTGQAGAKRPRPQRARAEDPAVAPSGLNLPPSTRLPGEGSPQPGEAQSGAIWALRVERSPSACRHWLAAGAAGAIPEIDLRMPSRASLSCPRRPRPNRAPWWKRRSPLKGGSSSPPPEGTVATGHETWPSRGQATRPAARSTPPSSSGNYGVHQPVATSPTWPDDSLQ